MENAGYVRYFQPCSISLRVAFPLRSFSGSRCKSNAKRLTSFSICFSFARLRSADSPTAMYHVCFANPAKGRTNSAGASTVTEIGLIASRRQFLSESPEPKFPARQAVPGHFLLLLFDICQRFRQRTSLSDQLGFPDNRNRDCASRNCSVG